jgi:hypothetical protein
VYDHQCVLAKLCVLMLDGEDYETVLRLLPAVEFAFSYGSGVFRQTGYDYSAAAPQDLPMCDFIFAVEDPIKVRGESHSDSMTVLLLVASREYRQEPLSLQLPLGQEMAHQFHSSESHPVACADHWLGTVE